ncbi:MAG TPA: hypothetical protein VGA12_01300 [Burkholderiales bacterium]|jgi:hypothetical protein
MSSTRATGRSDGNPAVQGHAGALRGQSCGRRARGGNVDQHAFLPNLIDRRVRLTTSAGSNGEPVAQTAICGLLMLARGFPHWWTAQGRPLQNEI